MKCLTLEVTVNRGSFRFKCSDIFPIFRWSISQNVISLEVISKGYFTFLYAGLLVHC